LPARHRALKQPAWRLIKDANPRAAPREAANVQLRVENRRPAVSLFSDADIAECAAVERTRDDRKAHDGRECVFSFLFVPEFRSGAFAEVRCAGVIEIEILYRIHSREHRKSPKRRPHRRIALEFCRCPDS
jgi:hypothetical protein